MVERLIIDANSCGHASHQGTTLRSGVQETQAVFGIVKLARMYRVRYPNSTMLWLWDGDSWRKSVSDTYKANRTDSADKAKDRERYKSQAPFMRRALRHLGMPQLSAANMEADDIAAIMSRKFVEAGDEVRMITGDRDWQQLVNDNCTWEDHRDDKKFVTSSNFKAVTGYNDVRQFLSSKALQGDTSDNISGVGQIGEVKAKELISIWGSVLWFLADPDREASYKEATGKNLPKALRDFASMPERQERYAQNMRLMSLIDPLPEPVGLRLDKGAFNPDEFKSVCQELGFSSIFRPEFFDNWVAPFKPK